MSSHLDKILAELVKSQNNDVHLDENRNDESPLAVANFEQLRSKRLENDGVEQNFKQRRLYAMLTFILVSSYIITVFIVVFMCGYKEMTLSDGILYVLLGTSLAQIIGLFTFVMKDLFPSSIKQK